MNISIIVDGVKSEFSDLESASHYLSCLIYESDAKNDAKSDGE